MILLEAACPALAAHPDLVVSVQTDWLDVERWRSAKPPWGPWTGLPFWIHVADREELRRGGPRIGTHAGADIWLNAKSGVMTFRLGGDGVLVRARELEALEATVLSAPNRSAALAQRLLVESGALYPPDQPAKVRQRAEAFLNAIEPLVGKARITEIDFGEVPPPEPPNERPWENRSEGGPSVIVSLKWYVRAMTPSASLSFQIDPIRGNVVHLTVH